MCQKCKFCCIRSTETLRLGPSRLCHLEIILDSHKLVRNNREIFMRPSPFSLMLTFCKKIGRFNNKDIDIHLIDWLCADPLGFIPTICVANVIPGVGLGIQHHSPEIDPGF